MGKCSRKMKRKVQLGNKQNLREKQLPQDFLDALERIREYKDNGCYDDGLQACIDLFEKYGVKADAAYEVAELYYLSGDYEHCAIWCENTLNLDNQKVDVYLLLSKIALLKDQLANALALLEKIIIITNSDIVHYREDMEELLNLVLIDYDESDVQSRYPLVWKTLKNINNNTSAEIKYSDEQDDMIIADNIYEAKIEELQLAIMKEPISLIQKITLCHKKAAEFYKNGDFNNALEFLKLAMTIDNTNNITLKNMGFLLVKIGKEEEAKAYFKKIEEVDLMIIDMIN